MQYIRVSQGTAAVLGLLEMRVDVLPTTAYLMLWHPEKCLSNCQFCPQANRSSSDERLLSRVLWPEYNFTEVIKKMKYLQLEKTLKRICVQTINYPHVFDDAKEVRNG